MLLLAELLGKLKGIKKNSHQVTFECLYMDIRKFGSNIMCEKHRFDKKCMLLKTQL